MSQLSRNAPHALKNWRDYFDDDKDRLIEQLIDTNIELSKELRSTKKQLKLAIYEVEQHRKRAETDQLTGVGSRYSIEAWAAQYYHPDKHNYLAIAYDLVNFKYLNDTYGHTAGDRALATFASKLLRSFRFVPRTMADGMFYSRDGLYVRQGGDEFAVVLMVPRNMNTEQFTELISKRIKRVLYVSYSELDLVSQQEEANRRIDCRYGMAVSQPGMSLHALLASADAEIVK